MPTASHRSCGGRWAAVHTQVSAATGTSKTTGCTLRSRTCDSRIKIIEKVKMRSEKCKMGMRVITYSRRCEREPTALLQMPDTCAFGSGIFFCAARLSGRVWDYVLGGCDFETGSFGGFPYLSRLMFRLRLARKESCCFCRSIR